MAEAKGSYVGGTPVYFKDEKARAMLSNEYVPAENYAAGNLCIHEGKLYKATKATTGTWDATAWTETNLAEVNAGMQKSITDLTEKNDMIQIGSTETATLTTKSWTQGDGGASIIIPEDGWYYIESSFSKNLSGNNYDDYLKFQTKLGSNIIISQSSQGLYNMTEITTQTISKFSIGDKVYLNVHAQEAGLKIDTKMIGIRLQSIR